MCNAQNCDADGGEWSPLHPTALPTALMNSRYPICGLTRPQIRSGHCPAETSAVLWEFGLCPWPLVYIRTYRDCLRTGSWVEHPDARGMNFGRKARETVHSLCFQGYEIETAMLKRIWWRKEACLRNTPEVDTDRQWKYECSKKIYLRLWRGKLMVWHWDNAHFVSEIRNDYRI